MLASLSEYLYVWQWPLVLVFIAGWLGGGGYLLQRSMRNNETSRRKPRYGRYFLASFLAGAAGAVAGAVIFGLLEAIGSAMETNLRSLALILAVLATSGVAYLVLFAMFQLSAVKTLTTAAPAFGATAALAVVVALAAILPAYGITQARRKKETCKWQMLYMNRSIKDVEAVSGSTPPNTLQQLVTKGVLTQKRLGCPAAPQAKVGYFYIPAKSLPETSDSKAIRACDFRDNHGGDGRTVLFLKGLCRWYTEEEFQELLDLPENSAFAAALREAEGK